MQIFKPTFLIMLIGRSGQHSHMKQTLTFPRQGRVRSPLLENIKFDIKWVANLNVYKAPGPDGLNSESVMYQTSGSKKLVLLFFFSLFLKMKMIMLLIVDQCCSQASVCQTLLGQHYTFDLCLHTCWLLA